MLIENIREKLKSVGTIITLGQMNKRQLRKCKITKHEKSQALLDGTAAIQWQIVSNECAKAVLLTHGLMDEYKELYEEVSKEIIDDVNKEFQQ